jgi:2-desacetyl-2-hydroxyethyl bacteriochlorophyllide A dehydrogenase
LKVVTLFAPNEINLSEAEIPIVKDDEVLVKTLQVGICGTDQKMFKGTYSGVHKYPVVPGHEWIGEIQEIGCKVRDGFNTGDRVIGSVSMWCGECLPCQTGNSKGCQRLTHFGLSTNGAAREYFTIKPKFLFKIPSNIDVDTGVLVEPLSVAYHGLELIKNPLPFNSIAVFGAGPIGLSFIAMAKMMGVKKVISIDFLENRLEAAKRQGAHIQINGRDEPIEQIMRDTQRMGVDLCIDAAGGVDGYPPAIHTALKTVRKSGKLLLVGYYHNPITLQLEEIVDKGIILQGKIPGAHIVFQKVIDLLSSSKTNIRDIITSHFSLPNAEIAFKAASQKEREIKVVIRVTS